MFVMNQRNHQFTRILRIILVVAIFIPTNGFTAPSITENQSLSFTVPQSIADIDCAAPTTQLQEEECEALVALYTTTDGDNWTNNQGWGSDLPACQWHGITCNQDNQVIHLTLDNNNLTGTLPAALTQLSHLTYLGLWDNQLSGPLPTTLGFLRSLVVLDLHGNQLTGPFPSTIGSASQLTNLWMGDNAFSGEIPTSIGQLANLETLRIENNQLSGTLPTSLMDLTKLAEIKYAYNAIQTDGETMQLFRSGDGSTLLNDMPSQTIPPTEIRAEADSNGNITLSWVPILYQDGPGHYEIHYATNENGPFEIAGTTADKAATSYTLTGLPAGGIHYLQVRTFTPANGEQKNDLYSSYSELVAAGGAIATPTPDAPTTPQTLIADLQGTALEVTQGVQNLANEMPLIEDRPTWARGYVKSDLYDTEGVNAQLRGYRDGVELEGSPLSPEYGPITVRSNGGERTNLDESFPFFIPPNWRTGEVTLRLEINHDGAVIENESSNNSLEEIVTFHPSQPLNLVFVPLKLYKDGDESNPPLIYDTSDEEFNNILANTYRYLPVAKINWREHPTTIEPDCDGRKCNIMSGDQSTVLTQVEALRLAEEGVQQFYQTTENEHWIGMVHHNMFYGGLAMRPLKPYWEGFSAYTSVVGMLRESFLAVYELNGSKTLAHELSHNLGMMHINCGAGSTNVTEYFPTASEGSEPCSLDTVDPAGYYAFDVYYTERELAKPSVISNDPEAPEAHRAFPMMSYRGPGWVSPYKYCQLLIKVGVPCNAFDYSNIESVGGQSKPEVVIEPLLPSKDEKSQEGQTLQEHHEPLSVEGSSAFVVDSATISGVVWHDSNPNGYQDLGFSLDGLPNVELKLIETASNLVLTTTTDTGGYYIFDNLPAGDYTVEVLPASIFAVSPQHAYSDTTIDNDFHPESYTTNLITLTAGATAANIDAGLYSGCTATGTYDIDYGDCLSLVEFYSATGGDGWTNTIQGNAPWDFSLTPEPCNWYGVTCNSDNDVRQLALPDNNLHGPLPLGKYKFYYLRVLDLSSNQLTGAIPSIFDTLTNLRDIDLSENKFTGSIPEFDDTIETINLAHNALTGEIPITLNEAEPDEILVDYNGLWSNNSDLIDLLDDTNPSWESSQTVPPTNLAISNLADTSLTIYWTVPSYTGDNGGYKIYQSTMISGTTEFGPYLLVGTVNNKATNGHNITNLSPSTDYSFKIRMFTEPHGVQKNRITSEFSSEVQATTRDLATLTIVDTDGVLLVTEDGVSDTIFLSLGSVPTEPVTVSITTDGQTSATPSAVTFDATNWDAQHPITIDAIDDAIDEADQINSIVTLTTNGGGDPAYAGLSPTLLNVTVDDNDTPTVSLLGADLTVAEEPSAAINLTVETDIPSTEDIVVSLNYSGTATLYEDYTAPLTLTISAGTTTAAGELLPVDDSVVEPDESIWVNIASASGVSAVTAGTEPFSAVITNDDLATVFIDTGRPRPEGDAGTSVIQIEVGVDKAVSGGFLLNYNTIHGTTDNDDVLLDNGTITFVGNENETHHILMTILGDNQAEDDETVDLDVHIAQSTVSSSIQVVPANSSVQIVNDDAAGLVFTTTDLLLTEGGAPSQYSLHLQSQPQADVILSANHTNYSNGASLNITPVDLIFTPLNWSEPQTVTVAAVEDDVATSQNIESAVEYVATSSDRNYAFPLPNSVNVFVTDNDSPGISITETDGQTSVSEVGVSDTYAASLTSQPLDDVTIQFIPDGELSVSPSTLTFNSANWSDPQAVTVNAVNDQIAQDSPHMGQVSHVVTSNDASFHGLALPSINVAIEDNDWVLINGIVWEDMDGNGLLNSPQEPPLPNVEIQLWKDTTGDQQPNQLVDSAYTTGDGEYSFNIERGIYQIKAIQPNGYLLTTMGPLGANNSNPTDSTRAVDPSDDSDIDPQTGQSAWLSAEPEQFDIVQIDIGAFRRATVGSFIWSDDNANGLQDLVEPGIANVEIAFESQNSPESVPTVVAAADSQGRYTLDLMPGSYAAKINLPAGYSGTTPFTGNNPAKDSNFAFSAAANSQVGTITVGSGEVNHDFDAGFVPLPTHTPTHTATPTARPTHTATPMPTPTPTPTITPTSVSASLEAATSTPTPTITPTPTPVTHIIIRGTLKLSESKGVISSIAPAAPDLTIQPEDLPEGLVQYEIVLLDADGDVLETYSFSGLLANIGDEINDDTYFEQVIPVVPGYTSIEIRIPNRDTGEIETIAKEDEELSEPPTITIITPNEGTLAEGQTIIWEASDPDNDPLSYSVFFSPDDGITWQILGADLTESRFTLPSIETLPGGNQCRIKVMVSDGFHTAIDITNGRLIIPDKPPIIELETQEEIVEGERLTLNPAISDLEDKDLQIVWKSQEGEVLGSGKEYSTRALAAGEHVITVTATDTKGNRTVQSIVINVTEAADAPNKDPLAINDAGSTSPDHPIAIRLLFNDDDPDGDPLTVTAASANHGSVTFNGEVLYYLPSGEYAGTDQVTYTASDGRGGESTATIHINIISGASSSDTYLPLMFQ